MSESFLRAVAMRATDASVTCSPRAPLLQQLSDAWQSLTDLAVAAREVVDEALAGLFAFSGPSLGEVQVPALSMLLLGPSGAGKTTMFRAALSLSGEAGDDEAVLPPAATRGLVKQVLRLPYPDSDEATVVQARQPVLLCDAGGGRQERRQWIVLVREAAPIACLVFVADLGDDSGDTQYLFQQLANAPWARDTALWLALTHVDVARKERGEVAALDLCAARKTKYCAKVTRHVEVRYLDARHAADAAILLMEATAAARGRQLGIGASRVDLTIPQRHQTANILSNEHQMPKC